MSSTAPSAGRILIVEDNANERESLAHLLSQAGYHVSSADSGEKALGYLDEPVDCVLTDLQMEDVSGIELLKHWKSKSPHTMFLLMTGQGSTQTAVDAIKAGAYHYMTKPVDTNALLIMLQNMVRHQQEAKKVTMLQGRLDEKFSLSNIIGRSSQMQRVFELIRRSAQAHSTVLILGESGTGKELVAEAIHQNSPRRNGPFVAVNCAAMPASLVESELFGHERGAFTGATERRVGRFEAACGGTLFIDEIGDFDVSLQVKLLRVLESRAFTTVGGGKEIKTDVRVLAATSRDIRDMMAKGQFREDLYYRLNVITIDLPPLRQRTDDIPLLAKRFMDRVNTQNGTKVAAINPSVVDALQHYHWPGNVRELLNVIERMIVLSDRTTLEPDDLPAYLLRGPGTGDPTKPATGEPSKISPELLHPMFEQLLATMALDDIEKIAIQASLKRFHNNRTRAAHSLGISVRTLQRKVGPHHAPQDHDPAHEAPPRYGVVLPPVESKQPVGVG